MSRADGRAAGSEHRTRRPAALLLSWTALSWGIAHVNGYYAGVALLLVLVGAGLLLAATRADPRGPRLSVAIAVMAALLAATPLLHLQRDPPVVSGSWWVLTQVLAGASVLLLAVLLAAGRSRPGLVGVVVALAVLADLTVIQAAPDPQIDVWTLLQQSSDGLRNGLDMYQQSWRGSTGLTDVYPYLPATTLLLAPARWLLGDVRYALVGCSLASTLLLLRLARPAARVLPAAALLPALVVAYPRAVLVAQNAWTEPLLLLLLVGFVSAVLGGRTAVAVGLLALALASKQHVALLLPVAGLWPAFGWRRAALAAGAGVALVLPWLLAGPRALWDDAVVFNLAYGVKPEALDLPAFAARHGLRLGFAVTLLALLLAYTVCVRCLPQDAGGFAAGSALVLLLVALTNKQSFFNHYTLVTGLLVTAAVLWLRPAAGQDAPRLARAGRREG